jgi:hypothetical protein
VKRGLHLAHNAVGKGGQRLHVATPGFCGGKIASKAREPQAGGSTLQAVQMIGTGRFGHGSQRAKPFGKRSGQRHQRIMAHQGQQLSQADPVNTPVNSLANIVHFQSVAPWLS